MQEELAAFHQNDTWDLVPRTSVMNVVGYNWVFKIKLKSDGTVDRLKAQLVAKGFNQVPEIDLVETFSPIIKPATIRIVSTIVIAHNWSILQVDVKNAFLHRRLTEPVFME